MTECIMCSCSDYDSCVGGCHWLHKSADEKRGICSTHEDEIASVGVDELEAMLEEDTDETSIEELDFNDQAPSSGILQPGDPEYEETLRLRNH